MVVTGDPSQTDLEPHQKSGLNDAMNRLRGFQDVGVVEFGRQDIVRHPLVEQIVRAYEGPPRDAVPPREAGREGGREGGRDGGREAHRDGPREVQRDGGRDPHGREPHGRDAHGRDAHGRDPHGRDPHRS
jgi:hypothetical protein